MESSSLRDWSRGSTFPLDGLGAQDEAPQSYTLEEMRSVARATVTLQVRVGAPHADELLH